MIVHKFGGSSLATAEKIKNVSNIINCKDEAVVVSASAKTTRNLTKNYRSSYNSPRLQRNSRANL